MFLAAFVVVELRQARPMVDLTLFRRPAFLGIQLAKAGCTKVGAIVLSIAPTLLGAKWLGIGLKSKGVSMDSVQVGLTQADFSAPVSQLVSEGVNCIVPVTAPQQGSS